MVEFFINNIIHAIYVVIFLLIFLGLYKIVDFPKYIIKDRMKIKNEMGIFLMVIVTPFIFMILTNFVLENVLKLYIIYTDILDALFLGFMWSMAINFKKYK